ncbi:MAG: hypothetical protein RLZZ410_1275 [Pseudomonadota bacterium]
MNIENKNSAQPSNAELRVGQLARELLNDGAEQLPKHILARLNQARSLALSHYPSQKEYATESQWSLAGMSGAFSSNWAPKIWSALGVAPIFALALGLFAIANWQQDERIKDIASVDSAILTDIVPLEAYKDDGYVRFLMTNGKDLIVEDDEEKI